MVCWGTYRLVVHNNKYDLLNLQLAFNLCVWCMCPYIWIEPHQLHRKDILLLTHIINIFLCVVNLLSDCVTCTHWESVLCLWLYEGPLNLKVYCVLTEIKTGWFGPYTNMWMCIYLYKNATDWCWRKHGSIRWLEDQTRVCCVPRVHCVC